jgi:hypothetical protein
MQKGIAVLLILASFALLYFGIRDLDEKKADVKIGDVEITASSHESNNKAYVLIGAGVICIITGVVLLVRTKPTA